MSKACRCAALTVAPDPRLAMNPYAAFLLYLLAILAFVFVTLVMNRYLGPKPAASALKMEPFECGATAVDARNTKAVPIKLREKSRKRWATSKRCSISN